MNYYEELCERLSKYTYNGSRDICDEAIEAIKELMKSNIIIMNQLREAKGFIQYLDKKYSYVLPEDKKFNDWR